MSSAWITVDGPGPTALVIAVALVVSMLGGWGLTAAVLAGASRVGEARLPRPRRPAPPAARRRGRADVTRPRRLPRPAPSPRPGEVLLRGGLAIGLLERTAVTLALIVGHPEALAVVVAIKGLGRFAELAEKPAAAERFVIGSLASLLWAAVVGYGTANLLA
jgi:hypothetical protein